MSDHRAVATVTAALQRRIETAAGGAVTGALAVTERPDNVVVGEGESRVGVFLYQVSPNPQWRNADLPTRRGDGTLARRPAAALDLHYLLTFFGEEAQQVPERLLGSVLTDLHSRPTLEPGEIEDAIADNAHLAGSNLAEAPERVRLVPLPLNLEELSKLWSVLFQTAYRLSVVYVASVVLLEPAETPRPAPPVLRRLVFVEPLATPVIEEVDSDAEPAGAVVAGDTLILRGRHLRGDTVRVRVGDAEGTPALVQPRQVRIPLTAAAFPDAPLRAGVQGVRLLQFRDLGDPPVPHSGPSSNVEPLTLRPRLTGVSHADGTITVTVEPALGPGQRGELLLVQTDADPGEAPHRYALPLPAIAADTATADVAGGGVEPGSYVARVRVDGAESLVELDGEGDPVEDQVLEVP